jgi:hypothetical protein
MLGRNSRRPQPTPRGRILLLLSRERDRAVQDRLLDELLDLDRVALAGLETDGASTNQARDEAQPTK